MFHQHLLILHSMQNNYLKGEIIMKRILFCMLVSLFFSISVASAEDLLTLGKYSMNDGKMKVAFEVKQINAGKYFIEGAGSNDSGAMCMMNGIGTFSDGLFQFGYKCSLKLTLANGKLIIQDEKSCTPCDPGAYISGTYEKQ